MTRWEIRRILGIRFALKRRKEPLFREQGEALEAFRHAVLDAIEPVVLPIIKWLDRLLRRSKGGEEE